MAHPNLYIEDAELLKRRTKVGQIQELKYKT